MSNAPKPLIPYYEKEDFVLYHGNCTKVLKKIPEKSVDMIFADPPYFLSDGGVTCSGGKQVSVNKGRWDKAKTVDERIEFNREWIRECRRVLKDDGSIWITGTFHNIYTIGVALEEEGFSIINNITQVKTNPPPNLACRCFTNSTETILWARKVLLKNKKGNHTFNYELMKELNNGKPMKDVWEINAPTKSEKVYGKIPAQKPLKLLYLIIEASTQKGDLILDPFSGSGTTGIAAKQLKRNYVGIDSYKKYLDISIKRYEDEEVKLV